VSYGAEFVVGAHPCYEGCSPGSPVFLKKKTNKQKKTKQNKTKTSISKFYLESVDEKPPCRDATAKVQFILLSV